MADDPFASPSDAMTVTLKYGKDFGDPWLVIRGSSAAETKRLVAEAVGIEAPTAESLTLAELIVNAKNIVQGANTVAAKLGGTALPRKSSQAQAEEQAPAAQATPENAGPTLLERIEQIENKQEGQKLFLANRAAIMADKALESAMQAKMTSL